MEKRTFFTINNKGELGGHDMDSYTAYCNLQIRREENPDEEWEMFDAEDDYE